MGQASAKTEFNVRAFAATLLAFSSVVLAVTGLLMWAWPGPRGSSVLGLDRHGCEALHISGGLLVIAATVFHLVYNWRTLLHHLRLGVGVVGVWRREWLVALVVLAVTVGGTLGGLPPFSLVAGHHGPPPGPGAPAQPAPPPDLD